MRRLLLLAAFVVSLLPVRPVSAATCTSAIGPGISPPATVPAGLPGFHAAWFGQSGYMSLCPGDTATAVVAYYNTGSRGWTQARMGEAAYLGTWSAEPGQDQASILGGDGELGSPATGWPRFNRVAEQPAAWVGPRQIAWFQFAVQAPSLPGTYRLGIRPLIEGATWMEDYGVFWQVTVLNPDGSAPAPTAGEPRALNYVQGGGLLAMDIHDEHDGIDRAAAFLLATTARDRVQPATIRMDVGTGAEQYCCITQGSTISLVTSNPAWRTPPAAAADTWPADIERTELAGHEYVHLWQHELGGDACMLGVRWIAEGMSESFSYGALVAGGIIPAANLDLFTRRQLRDATYVPLSSLETTFGPARANPFSVAYLAVDRLLAANGRGRLRTYCERVGAGQEWHAAFAATFGETTDSFYSRFESFRLEFQQ